MLAQASRWLERDDEALHSVLHSFAASVRTNLFEAGQSSFAALVRKLLPCFRSQAFSAALAIFGILAETLTCLADNNYQARPTVVCMVDGITKRNIVMLVEITMDVLKCVMKNTSGERMQVSPCPQAEARAQQLVESMSKHSTKVCEIFNREVCRPPGRK